MDSIAILVTNVIQDIASTIVALEQNLKARGATVESNAILATARIADAPELDRMGRHAKAVFNAIPVIV